MNWRVCCETVIGINFVLWLHEFWCLSILSGKVNELLTSISVVGRSHPYGKVVAGVFE